MINKYFKQIVLNSSFNYCNEVYLAFDFGAVGSLAAHCQARVVFLRYGQGDGGFLLYLSFCSSPTGCRVSAADQF